VLFLPARFNELADFVRREEPFSRFLLAKLYAFYRVFRQETPK
jgi:hypothetical protein